MQAFGRRVLDVAHVEIKAATIQKKTAVAWGLFVIAIVKVDRTRAGFVEEIVFDFGRPNLRIAAQLLAAHQAAIFSLNPNDPVHEYRASDRVVTSTTGN